MASEKKPLVSIIICTRNRAKDLRQTLEAIGKVEAPAEMPAEVLVVDNGSTDETAEVARSTKLPRMSLRYVREPRREKGTPTTKAWPRPPGKFFYLRMMMCDRQEIGLKGCAARSWRERRAEWRAGCGPQIT